MSESTIRRFLDALGRHDGAALSGCYHPAATFSDPIHPDVRNGRIDALWQYRLARLDTVETEILSMSGDDRKARMRWTARWRRRGGGRSRRVHRLTLESTFTFWDERIARQVDAFAPWAYLRQTCGVQGLLTGWWPGALPGQQARAADALDRFIMERPSETHRTQSVEALP